MKTRTKKMLAVLLSFLFAVQVFAPTIAFAELEPYSNNEAAEVVEVVNYDPNVNHEVEILSAEEVALLAPLAGNLNEPLLMGANRDYGAAPNAYVFVRVSTRVNNLTYGWGNLTMQIAFDGDVLQWVPQVPTRFEGEYEAVGGNWSHFFAAHQFQNPNMRRWLETSGLVNDDPMHAPSTSGIENNYDTFSLIFQSRAGTTVPRNGLEFYIVLRFRVIGDVGDTSEIMVRTPMGNAMTSPGYILANNLNAVDWDNNEWHTAHFGLVTVIEPLIPDMSVEVRCTYTLDLITHATIDINGTPVPTANPATGVFNIHNMAVLGDTITANALGFTSPVSVEVIQAHIDANPRVIVIWMDYDSGPGGGITNDTIVEIRRNVGSNELVTTANLNFDDGFATVVELEPGRFQLVGASGRDVGRLMVASATGFTNTSQRLVAENLGQTFTIFLGAGTGNYPYDYPYPDPGYTYIEDLIVTVRYVGQPTNPAYNIAHAVLRLNGADMAAHNNNGVFTLDGLAKIDDILVAEADGFSPSGNRVITMVDADNGEILILLGTTINLIRIDVRRASNNELVTTSSLYLNGVELSSFVDGRFEIVPATGVHVGQTLTAVAPGFLDVERVIVGGDLGQTITILMGAAPSTSPSPWPYTPIEYLTVRVVDTSNNPITHSSLTLQGVQVTGTDGVFVLDGQVYLDNVLIAGALGFVPVTRVISMQDVATAELTGELIIVLNTIPPVETRIEVRRAVAPHSVITTARVTGVPNIEGSNGVFRVMLSGANVGQVLTISAAGFETTTHTITGSDLGDLIVIWLGTNPVNPTPPAATPTPTPAPFPTPTPNPYLPVTPRPTEPPHGPGYVYISRLEVLVVNQAAPTQTINHAILYLNETLFSSTSDNGLFVLENVARIDDVLEISARGFVTQIRVVTYRDAYNSYLTPPVRIEVRLVPQFTVTFNSYNYYGSTDNYGVIVVTPSAPGSVVTLRDILTPEIIAASTHQWGTSPNPNIRGFAFWGWFTDLALDAENRRDPDTNLRRPTVGTHGVSLDLELTLNLFNDGYNNFNLYAIWALWGDANDDDRFTHADLILVQSQLLGQAVTMNTWAANVAVVFNAQTGMPNITHASLVLMQSRLLGQSVIFGANPNP